MNYINAKSFKLMLESALKCLINNKEEINRLNVFPIPNHDTGSNVVLSFESGIKEINNINNDNVGYIVNGFYKGLLVGSKGSSGIVLSQIFNGFSSCVHEKEYLDVDDIANAFKETGEFTYKGIMKPIEGTMLSVFKNATYNAYKTYIDKTNMSIQEYFEILLRYANEYLGRTTMALPTLKENGVVDAGAYAVVCMLEGFKNYIDNPID